MKNSSDSFSPRTATSLANVLVFSMALLAGCGGSVTSPRNPSVLVVLDVTRTLVQGVTCDAGGVDAEFTGQAGTTVVISAAAASNMMPQFTLYAPDYTRQVGSSSPSGSGRSGLTATLTESGLHHLTACEPTGIGGSVRLTVTRQLFGG